MLDTIICLIQMIYVYFRLLKSLGFSLFVEALFLVPKKKGTFFEDLIQAGIWDAIFGERLKVYRLDYWFSWIIHLWQTDII